MVWKGTRAIFNSLMADLAGRTMPRKRRKAPEVQTIDCDVELSQSLSHELASTISQDICKHILFMRNQIPRLYNELAATTEVNLMHALPCCTLDCMALRSVVRTIPGGRYHAIMCRYSRQQQEKAGEQGSTGRRTRYVRCRDPLALSNAVKVRHQCITKVQRCIHCPSSATRQPMSSTLAAHKTMTPRDALHLLKSMMCGLGQQQITFWAPCSKVSPRLARTHCLFHAARPPPRQDLAA